MITFLVLLASRQARHGTCVTALARPNVAQGNLRLHHRRWPGSSRTCLTCLSWPTPPRYGSKDVAWAAGARLDHGNIVGAVADGQAARARARHLPLRQPWQAAHPAQHVAAPLLGGRRCCFLRLMHIRMHVFRMLAGSRNSRQARHTLFLYSLPLSKGKTHASATTWIKERLESARPGEGSANLRSTGAAWWAMQCKNGRRRLRQRARRELFGNRHPCICAHDGSPEAIKQSATRGGPPRHAYMTAR